MSGNPPEWNPSDFDPENTEGNYILKYRKPVPCPSLNKLGQFMAKRPHKKRVRSTYIGKYWVSTVFLFIDHNWLHDGEPLLFETMIFAKEGTEAENEDDELHTYCERTTTWRNALKQHWQVVEKVKNER